MSIRTGRRRTSRFPKMRRRVRIYPYARQATELSRSARRQAAEREYILLEGIHHAGILKALEFHEHERGPALIFEHDPEAERLDWFLRDRGETLDIDTRLALVRQLAETLQHAHERPAVPPGLQSADHPGDRPGKPHAADENF